MTGFDDLQKAVDASIDALTQLGDDLQEVISAIMESINHRIETEILEAIYSEEEKTEKPKSPKHAYHFPSKRRHVKSKLICAYTPNSIKIIFSTRRNIYMKSKKLTNAQFLKKVESIRKDKGFTYLDNTGKEWTGEMAIAKHFGMTRTEYSSKLKEAKADSAKAPTKKAAAKKSRPCRPLRSRGASSRTATASSSLTATTSSMRTDAMPVATTRT